MEEEFCGGSTFGQEDIRNLDKSNCSKMTLVHFGKPLSFHGSLFAFGIVYFGRVPYVLTVGKDEDAVQDYIHKQEKEDKRIEQLKLF